VHPLVREAVLRIEQAGPQWPALSEETLAAELSISTPAVWRLLHQHLGLGFLECRRAVVMRRAVRELTGAREHVAQIAYGLGYEHASSFNRDFRRFLLTSPTAYRRLALHETDKE
jgi:AraC-like DNA-binding protein